MRHHLLRSDQLITWSVTLAPSVLRRVTKASPGALAAITSAARHPARFTHRALQALWQSRLQVRRGPWSRSKVLPLGELPEAAAADGLRTTGVLRPDAHRPGPLSTRPRDPRADLRDQPRAAAASRDALRCRGERHPDAHRLNRQSVCERFARHHAPGLARCRASGQGSCFGRGPSAGRQCGGGR